MRAGKVVLLLYCRALGCLLVHSLCLVFVLCRYRDVQSGMDHEGIFRLPGNGVLVEEARKQLDQGTMLFVFRPLQTHRGVAFVDESVWW